MRKDRSEKWEHSCMTEETRGHSDLILCVHTAPTLCQPLSMCRERSNVLTHFSVCTADISLSYADSNYLRTANPPEGGRGWGGRGGARDNSRATGERGRGRERQICRERQGKHVGRDACEVVSQHISNERDGSSPAEGEKERVLSGAVCLKYGLPLFPLQSASLPFFSLSLF